MVRGKLRYMQGRVFTDTVQNLPEEPKYIHLSLLDVVDENHGSQIQRTWLRHSLTKRGKRADEKALSVLLRVAVSWMSMKSEL